MNCGLKQQFFVTGRSGELLDQVEQVLTLSWPDAMITGVAFCGSSDANVAAVAYDVEEIRMWIGSME